MTRYAQGSTKYRSPTCCGSQQSVTNPVQLLPVEPEYQYPCIYLLQLKQGLHDRDRNSLRWIDATDVDFHGVREQFGARRKEHVAGNCQSEKTDPLMDLSDWGRRAVYKFFMCLRSWKVTGRSYSCFLCMCNAGIPSPPSLCLSVALCTCMPMKEI